MGRGSRCFFLVCSVAYSLLQAGLASAMAAGITHPPYMQIADGLVALSQTVPGWAVTIDYGVTPEGRPLRALRLADPRSAVQHQRPAVLITGSTHGDEYLHIEDRLAGWFLSHRDGGGVGRFFAAGGVLLLVPVVNPDGFAAQTRNNSHDVDINRDFAQPLQGISGFEEPESRALARWLAAEVATLDLALRMTLDYHCCSGALLIPRSVSSDGILSAEAQSFAVIGRMIPQAIDATYRYGSSEKLLGYTADGTSKDYFHATYGSLSFTFEGRYRSEAGRFFQHTQWWDRVLSLLVASPG